MFKPIAPVLKLVAAVMLCLGLIDAAVVRSGAYAPWIKFDSTAGATVATTMAIEHYRDPAKRNILVLGNSQVGEGFSATLADRLSTRADLHFINGAIPGTTPRVWNYLLRQVDEHADRFAAIVMMVDYDTRFMQTDFANYALDTSYVVPLLRIADILDYPASFTAPDQVERARRSILFPLQALHEDVIDFVAHRPRRKRMVRIERPGWIAATAVYAGHPEALPDLPMDVDSGLPANLSAQAGAVEPNLENYFRHMRDAAPPGLDAANQAYVRLWLGRIAQRYRAHGIPVIIFNVPRGPWKYTLMPTPVLNPALADLRAAGQITALPGDAFVALEQPQFFFDTLHMNRDGRERFTALLAQRIATLLPATPPH